MNAGVTVDLDHPTHLDPWSKSTSGYGLPFVDMNFPL